MRHYAKSNPFSDFLWIKDELLWNHSRCSCQNELVQRSFLWIIFHDSFTPTLAVRGTQELLPWIFSCHFGTFDYLSLLYFRLKTKQKRRFSCADFWQIPTDGDLQKAIFVWTVKPRKTEFLQLLSVGILPCLLLWVVRGVGFLFVCLLLLGVWVFFFLCSTFVFSLYNPNIFIFLPLCQTHLKCDNRF